MYRRWLAVLALVVVTGCRHEDARATLPAPTPGLYSDLGAADPATRARVLVGLPLRDEAGLAATLTALYDPTSPTFRQYLSPDAFRASHAPLAADVARVQTWATAHGLETPFTSTSGMLVELTGTVAALSAAFDADIHLFTQTSDDAGYSALLASSNGFVVPDDFGDAKILTLDPAAASGDLAPDPTSSVTPPTAPHSALTPSWARTRYGLDALAATGQGLAIGIVAAKSMRVSDAQGFWKAFGIERADPELVVVAEPPSTRAVEATLDVEWPGAAAPGARIVVYQAADTYETSLLYAFSETVARGEVGVVVDSFSHRETSASRDVAQHYEWAAQMAAALGITVVAASGDSNGVDLPASCPHITAVGGTSLTDTDVDETVWSKTGAGKSSYFTAPDWQLGVGARKRTLPDVALVAEQFYWVTYLGAWEQHGGTSIAAPIFAGMIASIDEARRTQGRPALGFVNPALYATPAAQASFEDVVTGSSDGEQAAPGWDSASGWGSPRAVPLAAALP